MTSLARIATESISAADEALLVTAAQACPVEIYLDADGRGCTRFLSTDSSRRAVERLSAAYIAAIHAAANTARTLDRDDAFSVASLGFVEAVMSTDLTLGSLAGRAQTLMRFAILEAENAGPVVSIKRDMLNRYRGLLRKHDGDIEAALAECREGRISLAPATFLSVHHALRTVSLDVPLISSDGDCAETMSDILTDPAHLTPGPEEAAVTAELSSWLLSLVPAEQERILRLAYGYVDNATEDIRVAAGFKFDELLSDAQTGIALFTSRARVQRARVAALSTMRAALQAEVNAA